MKKIKALTLIFLILTPTLVFLPSPAVKADAGKANSPITAKTQPTSSSKSTATTRR